VIQNRKTTDKDLSKMNRACKVATDMLAAAMVAAAATGATAAVNAFAQRLEIASKGKPTPSRCFDGGSPSHSARRLLGGIHHALSGTFAGAEKVGRHKGQKEVHKEIKRQRE